ncbi:hypothetical protein MMC25_001655 [Agyrium rufum]|nr:hypothetical protein [Agyrium rufum]
MKMRLNSGHQPPKDTSIAAVTTILANQITSNDHVEMQLHLDALVKMVQIRGGLRMLGMDGVLEKSIKLLDIQTAMFQNARPRFLASTTSESSSNAFAIMSLIDLEGFPYMDTSAVLFYLRKEIASLTKMYSRLMIDPSRTTTVQAMKFLSRRTDIEYILLLAAQGFAVMQGPDQDARLREACCLAGSIYVNYVLRGFKPSSALILKTLKKRLMTCVERFELETRGRTKDVPTSIAVLFWALNVGGTMSLDVTEKSWFMLRLSRTAKHFGVRDWKSASLLLGDYPWAVKLQNEAWESIWVDLEQSLVYD